MADRTPCGNDRCTGVHHHYGCVAWCSVEGCDRLAIVKGMCDRHYRITRRQSGAIAPPGRCSFDGCVNPINCSELCMTHWRQRRRGEPLRPIQRRPRRVDQYVRGVLETRERGQDCWLDWPYGRSTKVTGNRPVIDARYYGKNKVMLARFVLFVENGEWPTWACHRCPLHPNGENGQCWNPAHLYDGDAKTNGRDRAGRKRTR